MAGRNVSNVLWSPFSLRSSGGVKGRLCVFDPGVGWVFVVVLICLVRFRFPMQITSL